MALFCSTRNAFRLIFRFVIPIMPAEPQKPSLYERLGGIYSISCVVDDLIDQRISPHLQIRHSDYASGTAETQPV